MKEKLYRELRLVLSECPHVHEFLDDGFIKRQCHGRLKSHFLRSLASSEMASSMREHLPTLEARLAKLESIDGYERLGSLLRGAGDWDQHQETLAQLDATLWFKEKGVLREIAPVLPTTTGNADALLCWGEEHIYCEVTSFQSIAKAFDSSTEHAKGRIQMRIRQLRQREPWKTKEDLEHELHIRRAVRNLLSKTKKQLPVDCPGILAIDTGKSAVFHGDVSTIARQLFPSRSHVVFILLWSWESDEPEDADSGWKKCAPTYCFVNTGSRFWPLVETMPDSMGVRTELV